MNTEHYPQPDQNEIDRIAAQRTISDAELLLNGASFEEGRLAPTAEQVESLKLESAPAKMAGRLVLHSVLAEKASESIDTITKRAEALAGVREKIKIATEPYSLLFDEKIPSPSEKDKDWRGNLKKNLDIDPWTTSKTFVQTEAKYELEGEYRPGEIVNMPSKINMKVKGLGEKSKREPAIELNLGYDGANISTIDLDINQWESKVANARELSPNCTGELFSFIKSAKFPKYETKHENVQLQIRLSGDQLTMRTKNAFTGDKWLEYKYNPDTPNHYFHLVGFGAGDYSNFKQQIAEEEFVGIVSDVMGLLPSMQEQF